MYVGRWVGSDLLFTNWTDDEKHENVSIAWENAGCKLENNNLIKLSGSTVRNCRTT